VSIECKKEWDTMQKSENKSYTKAFHRLCNSTGGGCPHNNGQTWLSLRRYTATTLPYNMATATAVVRMNDSILTLCKLNSLPGLNLTSKSRPLYRMRRCCATRRQARFWFSANWADTGSETSPVNRLFAASTGKRYAISRGAQSGPDWYAPS